MEGACDFRDLCNYGYAPSDKEKRVQPHGSHLVLTLEQTNKQKRSEGTPTALLPEQKYIIY